MSLYIQSYTSDLMNKINAKISNAKPVKKGKNRAGQPHDAPYNYVYIEELPITNKGL